MSTISTTLSHAIDLGASGYTSPLTITEAGAVETTLASFAAILGPSTGGPWTIVNKGTVAATGSNGTGISLLDSGIISNSGDVSGAANGIFITGPFETVSNLGTISSTAEFYRSGVYLATHGTVANGSHGHSAALIVADWDGIGIAQAGGTVTNDGTIDSIGTHAGTLGFLGSGVIMPRGGYVLNHGLIEGDGMAVYIGGTRGVSSQGALGIVINSGTIESSGRDAIGLVSGGTVTNSGTVESTARDGVYMSSLPGTLTNTGTVASTASYESGVEINGGGIVDNGSHGKAAALIAADWTGLGLGAGGTLVNYGTVDSRGTAVGTLGHGGFGVLMSIGGEVYNYRLIEAAAFTAVYAEGARGVLDNFGTITSGGESAIDFADGGVVANGKASNSKALLQGGSNAAAIYMGGSLGTLSSGAVGTVTNFGTIESATTSHSGVELAAGGKVRNAGSTALIEGGLNGVSIGGSGSGSKAVSGIVVNDGTIEGTAGAGITLSAGGSVTNSGIVGGYVGIQASGGAATIIDAGTVEATGTIAVSLSGTAADLLVVDPGAVFVGDVIGPGNAGTLELAHGNVGTLAGIGTSFQAFGTIKVDPKASWVLSGDASASTLTNDGSILVHDSQKLVFGAVGQDTGDSGTIAVATSGIVEFTAAVASGQTFLFRDFTAFLKLDDLAGFAATIKGFRRGDTIDLTGITADHVVFSHDELAITNLGTPVATLKLQGHYKTSEFVVTKVGSDTEITIGAPPAAAPVFVYAAPGPNGGERGAVSERGPLYQGGREGSGDFAGFGGAGTATVASAGDPYPLLLWTSDPFHFWTIPS